MLVKITQIIKKGLGDNDMKNVLAKITLNSEYIGFSKFNGNKTINVLLTDIPKNTRTKTIISLTKHYLKDTVLKDIKDIEIIREVNVIDFLADYKYFVEGIKNIYDADIERSISYSDMLERKYHFETWYISEGTTNSIIDSKRATSWQSARSYFKKEGYEGKYLLHTSNNGSFKVIHVNI